MARCIIGSRICVILVDQTFTLTLISICLCYVIPFNLISIQVVFYNQPKTIALAAVHTWTDAVKEAHDTFGKPRFLTYSVRRRSLQWWSTRSSRLHIGLQFLLRSAMGVLQSQTSNGIYFDSESAKVSYLACVRRYYYSVESLLSFPKGGFLMKREEGADN